MAYHKHPVVLSQPCRLPIGPHRRVCRWSSRAEWGACDCQPAERALRRRVTILRGRSTLRDQSLSTALHFKRHRAGDHQLPVTCVTAQI